MTNQLSVSIEVNPEEIKAIVERQVQELTMQHLLYIDVNKILELTCMSRKFAEDYILSHPKMKVIERRRDRKKYYPYREFKEILDEIVNSW